MITEEGTVRTERAGIDWLAIFGPYLGLSIIILVFTGLIWHERGRVDLFLNLENLRLIALHASVTATVAIGMTLIMISGGIDLSVGYVVSLVTVVTVLVYRLAAQSGVPMFEGFASTYAIAAGLSTGVITGMANGIIITKLRIVPFVATLGMMGIARGLAQLLSQGQRIVFEENSTFRPAWVDFFFTMTPEPAWLVVSPSVWTVMLLAIVAAILLRYTVLGRYCYAIGSNEATARLCGINVDRTKIVLYALAGLATGWAGIIQTARSGAGVHDAAAGLELEVIAAVVIGGGSLMGGEGSISGTIIGALILAVLDNGCTKLGLSNEFRFVAVGTIIVLVAALNTWRQQKTQI